MSAFALAVKLQLKNVTYTGAGALMAGNTFVQGCHIVKYQVSTF
jgi:hypothetical protein